MTKISRRSLMRGAAATAIASSIACASAGIAAETEPAGGCLHCRMAATRFASRAQATRTSSSASTRMVSTAPRRSRR